MDLEKGALKSHTKTIHQYIIPQIRFKFSLKDINKCVGCWPSQCPRDPKQTLRTIVYIRQGRFEQIILRKDSVINLFMFTLTN